LRRWFIGPEIQYTGDERVSDGERVERGRHKERGVGSAAND